MATAILQPKIAHFRREFYQKLRKRTELEVFTFADYELAALNYQESGIEHHKVGMFKLGPIPIYFPWAMLKRRFRVWVIGGYWFHPATWILLLLGRLLGRKVLIWGHGVSVERYEREFAHPPLRMRLIYRLASGAMFYTEHELEMWRKIFPRKPMVSLGNTIGSVSEILEFKRGDAAPLKAKYGIATPFNFIFCARFNERERRADLLLEAVKFLPADRYGFIIIGAGKLKPDFSGFSNVHDFGQLYDDAVKRELFGVADCYFQPAWLGLSVVEAMAYALPVCTLKRGGGICQCVEYNYVEDSGCGILLNDIGELHDRVRNMTDGDFRMLGERGRKYVAEHLTLDHMVAKAVEAIGMVSAAEIQP